MSMVGMVGVRGALLTLCIAAARAGPQGINFGSSSSSSSEDGIANRNYGQQSGALHQASGHSGQQSQCCCIPQQQQCLEGGKLTQPQDHLVGEGLINERIVNRPGAGQQTLTCGYGQRVCCSDSQQQQQQLGATDYDFSVFERHPGCLAPQVSQAQTSAGGRWVQGCSETSVYGRQQCGTRPRYQGPVQGLGPGEASPGEFPWTCLILNQNNDFLGTCAIVPGNFNNDLNRGTRKILTAAHNLKKIGAYDRVKVRVGEYDASGFNPPERRSHLEYNVRSPIVMGRPWSTWHLAPGTWHLAPGTWHLACWAV